MLATRSSRRSREDYSDALVELRHWEGVGPAGASRAEDFRRIRDELEEEILGVLDGPHADDFRDRTRAELPAPPVRAERREKSRGQQQEWE